MRGISIISIGIAMGSVMGFLLGLLNCVEWRENFPGLARSLNDSVYEIVGALSGGTIGLMLGAMIASVARRARNGKRGGNGSLS